MARAEEVEPLPLIDRSGEIAAVATGHALRLPRRRSVPPFFVAGAAFLAVWVAFWSLLFFSYQFPSLEDSKAVPVLPSPAPRQETSWDPTRAIGGSATLGDLSPSRGNGIIELDGRCVADEEVVVSPPAGWRRH